MITSGIYSITNLKTGKVYYGSSSNIEKRWNGHKSKLRKGTHPNAHLQNSWKKWGEAVFIFRVEEEVSQSCLQKVEQVYLDWCKIFSNWSYNIGYDAECATRGIKFGPPSEEHRRKIGLANGGTNSVNYGKKLSDETKQKMSLAKKGVSKLPQTESHKRNLGLANTGEKNYRYDRSVYTFCHSSIGVEKCTRHELAIKYGLNKRGIGHLITKKRMSNRGWRLL